MLKIIFGTLFFVSVHFHTFAQTDSIKPNSEKPLYKNSLGLGWVDASYVGFQYQRFLDNKNHFNTYAEIAIIPFDWGQKYSVGFNYMTGKGKGFTIGTNYQIRNGSTMHFLSGKTGRTVSEAILLNIGWTFIVKKRLSIVPNLGMGKLLNDYVLYKDPNTEKQWKESDSGYGPVGYDVSIRFNYLF